MDGGPMDPLLLLMREQDYQVKLLFHWMLRVLDVPAALEARGYPAGVSGTLHLEVEDELFPENRGASCSRCREARRECPGAARGG